MKTKWQRAIVVVLGLVVAATSYAESLAYTKSVPPASVVKEVAVLVELTPLRQTQRPLGNARVAVHGGSDQRYRDVPVTLVVTRYWCKYLELRDSRAFESARQLFCYELVSEPQGDGFVHTWSMWRPVGKEDGPYGMKLLTPQGGGSYLTWTSGWQISLADVSHSRDRALALGEYLSRKPAGDIEDVPADSLPSEMTSSWTVARFSEFSPWMVEVESLTRDAGGHLTIALRDRISGDRAVLVKQKDGLWTLSSYTPASGRQPDSPAKQEVAGPEKQ